MRIQRVCNIAVLFLFLSFFGASVFLSGCANQQPPGGGEEDKIPPKVKVISPKPNTLNFKGNSVSFEFDEYVDRRGFQDAFRISPQIKGDIEFNWGSKDVEVVFPKSFYSIDPNKTFVITVNTALKDIHGNSIASPVAFAFATGDKIDEGSISGKVFNNNQKNIAVFAYRVDEGTFDPTKNLADYQTETSPEGVYTLTNLAPGNYRIIAIDDDDKNYLYTTDRESFGVLPRDLILGEKGIQRNVNIFMKQINASQVPAELNTEKYFKDSLSIVSSSIKEDYLNVLPDQSIFIFFNRFRPTREEFASDLKIKDENGTSEKVVLNWRSDSLVEIFSSDKFKTGRAYGLSFSLRTDKDTLYYYNLKFHVISTNSYGEMKGSIRFVSYDSTDITGDFTSIKLNLESKDLIPVIRYTFDLSDSVFTFNKILEADYNLFTYIDLKETGNYNYGYPFPFEYSDPFFIYPQTISIKGGWTVENVQINFPK